MQDKHRNMLHLNGIKIKIFIDKYVFMLYNRDMETHAAMRITSLFRALNERRGKHMAEEKNTMPEGTKTGTDGAEGTQDTSGRTFTQDDVNRIVQDRLQKERAKVDADREKQYADREKQYADREAELARREFVLEARKELSDRGLPEDLIDALNMSDKETFKNSLGIIEKYMKDSTEESNREYEQNRAVFTMPMHYGGVKDNIRAAMGLK